MLKQKGIKCESHKSTTTLFAYGGSEPLPTLGTFTADITLADSNAGYKDDFVVVKGNGRTLMGRETAEKLGILHIGPMQANTVSGLQDCDIRERYSGLFSSVVSSACPQNPVWIAREGG